MGHTTLLTIKLSTIHGPILLLLLIHIVGRYISDTLIGGMRLVIELLEIKIIEVLSMPMSMMPTHMMGMAIHVDIEMWTVKMIIVVGDS